MKNNMMGLLFGFAAAMGIPLGFIVLVSWWAEDRFGSGVVLMIWGGTLGLVAFTAGAFLACLLYTSPSPRDRTRSRMPSSA